MAIIHNSLYKPGLILKWKREYSNNALHDTHKFESVQQAYELLNRSYVQTFSIQSHTSNSYSQINQLQKQKHFKFYLQKTNQLWGIQYPTSKRYSQINKLKKQKMLVKHLDHIYNKPTSYGASCTFMNSSVLI